MVLYKVTISYIGYKDDLRTNISLALGEPTVINANLKEDSKTLGEVVVNQDVPVAVATELLQTSLSR